MRTLEETIEILEEEHGAEISKGSFHYAVNIWDPTEGCYQDLELTDDEVISLLEYIENDYSC